MVAVRDSHSIAICQKQDGGHFYHGQSVSQSQGVDELEVDSSFQLNSTSKVHTYIENYATIKVKTHGLFQLASGSDGS